MPWSAYNPREMLVQPADANHILLTRGQGVLGSGHLQTSAFPSDVRVCVCCRVREHVPLPWAVGWMFPVRIRSFGRIGSAQGNYTWGLGFLPSYGQERCQVVVQHKRFYLPLLSHLPSVWWADQLRFVHSSSQIGGKRLRCCEADRPIREPKVGIEWILWMRADRSAALVVKSLPKRLLLLRNEVIAIKK